jgi:DNA-binding NarL/FixJ family response regulator
MAVFDSAYNGCLAAIGMQQAIEVAGRVSGDVVGGLRVGVHVGEVVEDSDDDVYGAAVVVARRLCDAAVPGTILVSEVVSLLVANRADATFEPVDPTPLKGVPEPVTAALLVWSPLPEHPPVRVVVADDAALVRAGIVRLLADQGFEVVAEADDHDSLLAAVERTRPDLVVTDIRMPPGQHDEGLRAAAQIRTSQPDTAVLVLSQYIEASAAASLLDGQPSGIGYLLKERVSDLDEFVGVARRVAQGESVIDPLVTQQLLGRARDRDSVAQLTDREREVLDLMAQGLSNQDGRVARALDLRQARPARRRCGQPPRAGGRALARRRPLTPSSALPLALRPGSPGDARRRGRRLGTLTPLTPGRIVDRSPCRRDGAVGGAAAIERRTGVKSVGRCRRAGRPRRTTRPPPGRMAKGEPDAGYLARSRQPAPVRREHDAAAHRWHGHVPGGRWPGLVEAHARPHR